MARLRYFLCSTLLTLSVLLVAEPAGAQHYGSGPGPGRDVDISIFYENLGPYGEWIEMRPYGWVWSPYGVDYDWRPYQEGHWVWTEYGWTWVSDEPFGWATYHYGRWHYDPYYGWVWVPGTVWGPSWTAWREGDGWVGWAPLPPDDSLHVGVRVGGFNFRFDAIRRFHWNFVESRRFLEPRLRPHIARSVRNVNIFNQTNNVTNYNIVNNNIVNNSIQFNNIERRVGRSVPKYSLREVSRPRTHAAVKGNILEVFRPRISQTAPRKRPDGIFQRSQPAQSKSSAASDYTRRIVEERSALQRRMTDERAALEDREKREAARAPKLGWSTDELRKRQELERSAFQEQQQRQQKLLERFQDREQKGKNGFTKSQDRKYRFEPRQQKEVTKQQETPKKQDAPKKQEPPKKK